MAISHKARRGAVCVLSALALLSCSGAPTSAPSTKIAAVPVSPTELTGTPERVRLITEEQYFNTLTYIFGPEIKLAAHFAPMRRTDGLLEGGAASAGVTAGQLEQYQRTANTLATRIVDQQHRNFLVPCKPADEKTADKACATKFLSSVGRLLYRKPLEPERLQFVVDKAGENAERLKNFYAGLGIALEGLLISPNFLMVAEQSQADPDHAGRRRL